MKQFAYGLGDVALALTDTVGNVTTHHLQSDFASTSDGMAANQVAWEPAYQARIKSEHVTAKISDVSVTTATVQLMTDGCESAYFDSD